MCGIAGIIGSRLSPDALSERLIAMRDRLRHRGPNDAGEFFDPGAGTALGHTRLAILDLTAGGHQPMLSTDERFAIVFNGEVYNFRAIRAELEQRGETFRTQSDTEVLLRLYQRDGVECVNTLQGMFAFAVWDRHEKSCFFARDPLGIKPLYYWQHGETLAFASELRATLAAELSEKRLCAKALCGYLQFGSVQEPLTLVEGIKLLPAGQTMLWKHGSVQLSRYWELEFKAEPTNRHDAATITRAALDNSIRRHFVSDVPVGIFLSGGLDSTSIVALAKANGFDNLKTTCISFDEEHYNEGELASETAKHFKTQHVDCRLTAVDGRNLLNQFLQSNDQPSNDGFNTFCVSKVAHELGLRVVLSGLGGDELFGGYRSFQVIPKMMRLHHRLGYIGPVRQIAGVLGQKYGRSARVQRLGNYLQSSGRMADAYWAMRGFFTPGESSSLVRFYLGSEYDFAENEWRSRTYHEQANLLDGVCRLELTGYMRNQLLRDSDVMSMAWGLELRVPFVDSRLVDEVSRVPAEFRLAPGKDLLLAAVPEIPSWIAGRPKRGFTFPFERWLSIQWRDMFEQIRKLTPIPLTTWYRQWCLFSLNHFLTANGLCENMNTQAQQMLLKMRL